MRRCSARSPRWLGSVCNAARDDAVEQPGPDHRVELPSLGWVVGSEEGLPDGLFVLDQVLRARQSARCGPLFAQRGCTSVHSLHTIVDSFTTRSHSLCAAAGPESGPLLTHRKVNGGECQAH